MPPEVQAYIDRINSNDPTLTLIFLERLNLTDADIAPLMEALAANQVAAQRIWDLQLDGNQLTTALDLTGLTSLASLGINNRGITPAPLLTGLTLLETVYLNGITTAPILTGLNLISSLSLLYVPLAEFPNIENPAEIEFLLLSGSQIRFVPDLSRYTALTWLTLTGCQLTVASKIKLRAEQAIRGANCTLQYDQLPNDITLTHEILVEHFQAILANLQDTNNRRQPMRSMLVRGTGLPNELIRMVFDFLGENKASLIQSRNYMTLELNTFRNLLPAQQWIINEFESSSEFKKINAANCKSLSQLENEARADASGMKTLLNSYRRKRDTPDFQYLRDYTPVDPASNPYQVTVWRPRAQ